MTNTKTGRQYHSVKLFCRPPLNALISSSNMKSNSSGALCVIATPDSCKSNKHIIQYSGASQCAYRSQLYYDNAQVSTSFGKSRNISAIVGCLMLSKNKITIINLHSAIFHASSKQFTKNDIKNEKNINCTFINRYVQLLKTSIHDCKNNT